MTGLRACISIDQLPLQILLRENPGWAGTPVAVTRDERPQSPVLALNGEARARGLTFGMRYASALSLVPNLRARAVPVDRIAEARERIVRMLSSFTPDIEPCPFDGDAVWASVDGLRALYRTEALWSEKVRAALAAQGFTATVVVGFTRFGTYAVARSRSRSREFSTRQEEHALLARSPVDILPLSQRTRNTLRKLEIRTIRRFVSLPEGEVVRRFGREAGAVHRAILSDDPLPIQPVAITETVPCSRHLDAPLADLDLLMPHIEELLAIEAERVQAERSVIAGLTLLLRTEDGAVTTDLIRPAVPTLRTSMLRRLIHLRLSARQFSAGVEDIEIRTARAQPSRTQEELFRVRGRDLHAGARAFAAIRARFGNDSVTSARLADSWLPERSFTWVPIERPGVPTPASAHDGPRRAIAVRRMLFTPRQVPEGILRGQCHGEPYVISGSWWGAGPGDAAFHRHCFFRYSETDVAWLFVDKLTDTIWVQGAVD
jgi:protein ImuB